MIKKSINYFGKLLISFGVTQMYKETKEDVGKRAFALHETSTSLNLEVIRMASPSSL